ncbi:glycosyltransferase [Candidatus Woesebacteria bacterium]|nr:glycosyltransferase [Candidatus Woesebacteria bacterium]
MKKEIFLSVVIPAYNEEHNVRAGVLDGINDYLKDQSFSWEVIIVDDGSSDATFKLSDRFAKKHAGFSVMNEPHRGKGGTVIAGMLKAKGKRVLFTDMDQATPIDQLEKVLPKFKQGSDIVIGSRKGREGAPLVRKMMAYGFSLLRLLVLRLPYKDTQCGFKAFKKDASKEIFGKMKIYSGKMRGRGSSVSAGFDLEVLYLARKLGYKVAEVPVDWHHKEGTKVNPIKDSWEGLRDLFRVRLNAIVGRYDL